MTSLNLLLVSLGLGAVARFFDLVADGILGRVQTGRIQC